MNTEVFGFGFGPTSNLQESAGVIIPGIRGNTCAEEGSDTGDLR